MQQEDTPPSRQAPRFVPTLTEIVRPPGEAQSAAVTAEPPGHSEAEPAREPAQESAQGLQRELERGLEPEPKLVDTSELLESLAFLRSPETDRANDPMSELLARLGPELDVKMSEAIAQVMHEQMPVLNARVRQAVAEVVRETVAGVLSRGGASDPGENP